MKKYNYKVLLNEGYCDGIISVQANNKESSYQKAMDKIAEALKDFPVDVNFNVEYDSEEEINPFEIELKITCGRCKHCNFVTENKRIVGATYLHGKPDIKTDAVVKDCKFFRTF